MRDLIFEHLPLFGLVSLQDSPGVVTCMDNQPHGLETGQSIVFKEVNGMEELNGMERPITGITSASRNVAVTLNIYQSLNL